MADGPMLFAKTHERERWRWFERVGKFWVDGLDHRYISTDLEAIDRKRSDPQAIAIIDGRD